MFVVLLLVRDFTAFNWTTVSHRPKVICVKGADVVIDDWVKKCMKYAVEGPRPRGRPKRTWREVVRVDYQARKLNKEDAVDRCKWRKMIKDVR